MNIKIKLHDDSEKKEPLVKGDIDLTAMAHNPVYIDPATRRECYTILRRIERVLQEMYCGTWGSIPSKTV